MKPMAKNVIIYVMGVFVLMSGRVDDIVSPVIPDIMYALHQIACIFN